MFGLHLKQTIHNEGFKVCEYGFHFQINSIWVYISIRLGLVMGLMHIGMDFISKNWHLTYKSIWTYTMIILGFRGIWDLISNLKHLLYNSSG
jgi:hypothetical protein